MPLRIALTGPVQVAPLLPWLDAVDPQKQVPPGRGGTPVTQIARGLLDRGYELVVVSLDGSVSDEWVASGPRLRLRLGPYRPQHRARDAFRVERTYVMKALIQEQPDVVHAHWTYEYALGALAARFPTVVTVRDWAPTILRLSPTPYRAVRLLMNLQALRRARHFTVASPYMRDRLARWKRTEIPVVPNALDDEVFRRRARALNGEAPLLVAVNNGFDRRKNVHTLLEAYSHVRDSIPGARLRLMGGAYGPGEAAERWAVERDLAAGVEFCGSVAHSRLLDLLAEADIFVHPAREESFGMVVVEAMSQGVPVVAGAASGAVPWVLADGQAGVLTDISSSERLAESLMSLLQDPDRWQHFSSAGFEHASVKFRLSKVLDDYLHIYERATQEVMV